MTICADSKSTCPRPRPFQAIAGTVPHTTLPHGLTRTEIGEFYTKGFLILRGRFSAAEVDSWRQESSRLLEGYDGDRNNLRYSFQKNTAENDQPQTPWKIDPFTDLSALFARLVRDRRICDALASLYDGFEARLLKDKLIIKPAGSGGSIPHQDYNWWQGLPRSAVSVAVAIDATNASNGCTHIATGWQRGFLHQIGVQNGKLDDSDITESDWQPVELEPGDMAIFNCMAPHRAEGNRSAHPRRVMFLSYNDARDGEHYHEHYDHYFAYLTKGMNEDEIAAAYFS